MAVATREGGVDRNIHAGNRDGQCVVATREGGVDRNTVVLPQSLLDKLSPPARVAWIETLSAEPIQPCAGRRHPRGWRG